MKKLISILLLSVITISAIAQKKDTLKAEGTAAIKAAPLKPDSIDVLKDTLYFKVPKEMATTLESLLMGEDFSHKAYLKLVELWLKETPGFYIRKRKQ